ncbi:WhiB family transcriptional regulator [Actinomadura sp. NPDC049382]|uniref:WhiB family transcriptional regulator n=1 Tax=Actinomadura sp. NPDC049382 TaxID=3158220 RepID=UPI0034152EE8
MTVSQEAARLGRSAFTRSDWAWQESANCRGADLTLFFGTEGERAGDRAIRERKAKQVCAGCPVMAECLEEAYREPRQHGVWGGMGPEERTAARKNVMRRRREKGAA